MKRKRPEPEVMKRTRSRVYLGKVIPPRSVVKLLAKWGGNQGRIFRIGYYSLQDGLNCVWLVNTAGEYEMTTDQKSIARDFQILKLAEETDFYGTNRETLKPISEAEILAVS